MRHICDKKKAPRETCGAFLFKMFSKAGLLNTAVGFILPIISTPFMFLNIN